MIFYLLKNIKNKTIKKKKFIEKLKKFQLK